MYISLVQNVFSTIMTEKKLDTDTSPSCLSVFIPSMSHSQHKYIRACLPMVLGLCWKCLPVLLLKIVDLSILLPNPPSHRH